MGGAAPGDDVPPPAAASAPSPRLYPHLDLDFAPRLGIPALFSCVLLSWGAVLAYAVSIVKFHVIYPTLTLKMLYIHVASFAVVGAAAFWVAKTLFCEAQEQARLVPPEVAADADSLFADVDGVKVHYKKRVAASLTRASSDASLATPRRVVSCVHGFGANAYSWERAALGPLADRLGAFVVAHDAPGFGLTERSKDLRVYTPRANAGIARAMLDMLERESGAREEEAETSPAKEETETKAKTLADAAAALAAGDADPSDVASDAGEGRPAERRPSSTAALPLRRVVVGHSMGGVSAAMAAAEGGVDDVVLVAPAIFATGRAPASSSAAAAADDAPVNPVAALLGALVRILRVCFAYLVSPVLTFALRKLVRSGEFWRNGLAQAVGRASVGTLRSDSSWADGYRRPSAVAGWDVGMVRVVLAAATGGVSGLAGVFRGPNDAGADDSSRVAAALAASGARVLIVHGSEDAIVPAGNSERLQRMVPGAKLVVMQGVGHMPHEEAPERFLDEVEAFLGEKP